MPTAAPPTRSPAQTYPFYLGGLSAVGACLFTHPLDQTKYRLQVTQSKASVLGTISETIKSSGGARQLWAGLSASILRRATYSTARFWAYDVFKARAMRNRTGRPPIWLLGSCAGAAGGLAGIIGNPCEIVLVRMCTDAIKPVEQRYTYANGLQGIFRGWREEGTQALYRGVVPNFTRSVLMNVSQLAAYEYIKTSLLDNRWLPIFSDGVALHITSGLAAGTVATTICAPVDVLKSRVQSGRGQIGLTRILRNGITSEGVSFLFRGWTPAWLRLTPNTVLMFIFYEQLKRITEYVDCFRDRSNSDFC